jgi:hypothetical protein
MASEIKAPKAKSSKAKSSKFRPDYTHSHGARVCGAEKCKDRIRTDDSVYVAVGKVLWLSEGPMTAQEITNAVRKVLPKVNLELVLQVLDYPGGVRPVSAMPRDDVATWEHKWANDYASLKIFSTKYTANELVALLRECNARVLIPRRRTFRYVELASFGSVEYEAMGDDSDDMIENACIGCDHGSGREKYGFWPPPPDPRDEDDSDDDCPDHE